MADTVLSEKQVFRELSSQCGARMVASGGLLACSARASPASRFRCVRGV